MKGLIAAAGLGSRLQDLGEKRNKVLSDLGGETLLNNLLKHLERVGVKETLVVVGHDALAVRGACKGRAESILNPFYEHYGILSSIWLARPQLDGQPFVVTPGDHYLAFGRLRTFLDDQPEAEALADIELKTCDENDMKVFVNRQGKLRTITKTFLDGPVLGECTATVRFSADGSRQFFETLERYVWQHGVQGYLADVLCAYHRKWELAFHLSSDHRRVDVDFPRDLAQARDLYSQEQQELSGQ